MARTPGPDPERAFDPVSRIWFLCGCLHVLIYPLVILLIGLAYHLARGRPYRRGWAYESWGNHGMALLRVRFSVTGERLPAGDPELLVTNHKCWWDFLLSAGPIQAAQLARWMVLAAMPIMGGVGWFERGTIYFNRGKGGAATRRALYGRIKRRLATGSVVFYPEGHRNPADTLLPIKPGLLCEAYGDRRRVFVYATSGQQHVFCERWGRAHRGRTISIVGAGFIDPVHFANFDGFLAAIVAALARVHAEAVANVSAARSRTAVS